MSKDAGLEGFVKERLGVIYEMFERRDKQIADLRETLGGVETQVHELRSAPGMRNSISDLAAAGWPGLVRERDEARRELVKAQDRILDVMAQRDAYESALEAARDLITDRL